MSMYQLQHLVDENVGMKVTYDHQKKQIITL